MVMMPLPSFINLLKLALSARAKLHHLNSVTMKPLGSKSVFPFILLVIMTSLVVQGQSRSCASTFFSALVQLIPCRAAVAPFSSIPPSETCCNALKSIGQPCLCVILNGPPISGIDRNMALQLPDKCTINFDPCGTMK